MSFLSQNILIIDDDLLVIVTLEKVLEDKGYRVLNISKPENLLELIAKEKIDLIVLDLYLAGIDGIEVLKEIREKPENSNLPIIMLTSEESPDIIEKCLDSGATDFIIKPIVPKVLLARIRSALTNRDNIRQIEFQKTEITNSQQQLELVLRRLQKDIDKAMTTQTTLIPVNYIKSKSYEMHSYYKPMNQVGGDFFAHCVKHGKTDILFGDVSGHGISSAMVSCMAVLCFQMMPHNKSNAGEELLALHDTLIDYVFEHYMTGVYLRFNPENYTLSYAFAGHHSILLIRDGKLIELSGNGTPLVLMREFISASQVIKLEKGDRIFLFSDGLFEIFSKDNEFYGNEKFVEGLNSFIHLNGEKFLNAVFKNAMAFSSNEVKDDMTMLMLQFF